MPQTDRFWRRGFSKIKMLPAVAGSSPTRAEITAGVDLSPFVASVAGFKLKNSPITTPDLSTAFDSQIDGPDTVGDSSLTCYDGSTASTVRSTCPKGTTLFAVLMPYGDVAGKRCEVWQVRSTGVNDDWDLGTTAAQNEVGFAVLAVPNQNATIPA